MCLAERGPVGERRLHWNGVWTSGTRQGAQGVGAARNGIWGNGNTEAGQKERLERDRGRRGGAGGGGCKKWYLGEREYGSGGRRDVWNETGGAGGGGCKKWYLGEREYGRDAGERLREEIRS